MEVYAAHTYKADDKNSEELSFEAGDQLLVLNYGDQAHWLRAIKRSEPGRIGMVPENYLRIERPSWYLGHFGRQAAEQVLRGSHAGAFLVRLSESSPLDFSLSVNCPGSVQHFRILTDDDHQFFLWNARFNSLNELVKHYRTDTVSRTNQIRLVDLFGPNDFIVKAKYDFEASNDAEDGSELGFKAGDLIHVTHGEDPDWWGGRLGDREGFFPSTYVIPVDFGPKRVT